MIPTAKIVGDHVSPSGSRLVHVEAYFWRPLLAEVNTYRSHSRSSASSRARPIAKTLAEVTASPAWPLVYASEQRGMSGGAELEGSDLEAAQGLLAHIHQATTSAIRDYLRSAELIYGKDEVKPHVLHKSLLNRYLEPFMMHTAIMAATMDGWTNFFHQRCSRFSKKAQPEMMALADAIYDAIKVSTPTPIDYGEWVTPYMRPEDDMDLEVITATSGVIGATKDELRRQISTARCARVSYLTHDGVRDLTDDIRLFNETLMGEDPQHWAPSEFIATPAYPHDHLVLGNFTGWNQFRHVLMGRAGKLNKIPTPTKQEAITS